MSEKPRTKTEPEGAHAKEDYWEVFVEGMRAEEAFAEAELTSIDNLATERGIEIDSKEYYALVAERMREKEPSYDDRVRASVVLPEYKVSDDPAIALGNILVKRHVLKVVNDAGLLPTVEAQKAFAEALPTIADEIDPVYLKKGCKDQLSLLKESLGIEGLKKVAEVALLAERNLHSFGNMPFKIFTAEELLSLSIKTIDVEKTMYYLEERLEEMSVEEFFAEAPYWGLGRQWRDLFTGTLKYMRPDIYEEVLSTSKDFQAIHGILQHGAKVVNEGLFPVLREFLKDQGSDLGIGN